ncbi:MAG: hypothetical protein K0S58_196 [Nitrospira sp.]|jgi:uncharacterized membrane protein|nr:hypothetical protein [Nitrospira sp.]
MAQRPDHSTVEGFQHTVAQTWRRVSTNFWFLPTVLTLAALVIAPTLVQLDERLQATGRSPDWLNWIYGGGLSGARRLLSAIATAMMAIATVMFSSQTTALTFIGQEYGSWLLRNFLGDARNQLAFGTYISTFVYALMVLRTIHKEPDGAPVPHLALSFAIFLAMAGLGVLIYSMYHTSRFLQSSTIINYAAKDLTDTIRRLTTPSGGQTSPPAEWFPPDCTGLPVPAPSDGYVQYVKERRLITLCRQSRGRIILNRQAGDFVMAGAPLAVFFAQPAPADSLLAQIAGTIVLGPQPDIEQDLRYAFNQLVQIALRAASPDRNDVLTANMCVDRMGAALCLLAQRDPAQEVRCDDAGAPRVLARRIGFPEAVDCCVSPLRDSREPSGPLLLHILEVLGVIGGCVRREEDRPVLRREAEFLAETAAALAPTESARERIVQRYEDVCRALGCSPRNLAAPQSSGGHAAAL